MKARFAGLAVAGMALSLALAQSTAAQTVADASLRASTPTKWVVDMVHSQVDFHVRHLVGGVRGTFTRWYAVLTTDDGGWKVGNVNVSVQTASLNTGNSYRDDDLRSPRFFAASQFPEMTFQGTGFAATDSTVDLHGLLTIKGHSRPVTLSGQFRGIARDPEGRERIAFEASGAVDRRDFGMSWNETIAGNELVGNNVEITIGIEAVRAN
jgi:polyisoprenoid-binding protein YceI